MKLTVRLHSCAAALALPLLFWCPLTPSHAALAPIASSGTATTLPDFTGGPSEAKPLKVAKPPKHPFMSRNGRSNVHNDPWMTDTYWTRGPKGDNPEIFSTALGRDCISIAFDRKGRIVTACSNLTTRILYVLEPGNLRTLAEVDLPYVAPPDGQDPFTNSSGGVYFYLDRHDRAVIGAADGRVLVFAVGSDPILELVGEYDLSATLAGDRMTSVLPDWQGRLWFVSRYNGVVGTLDLETGAIESITLDEEIENSFAVNR
jgi:hypothetical protein